QGRVLMKRKMLSSLVVIAAIAGSGHMASGEVKKRVVDIYISTDNLRAKEDVKNLKDYEFLGVDYNRGTAQVRVSSKEIETLKGEGFRFSFAPWLDLDRTRDGIKDIEKYYTPSKIVAKINELH